MCLSCKKGKRDCIYQAPPPRRPKRKRNENVYERLERFERLLQDNGLLPKTNTILLSHEEMHPHTQQSALLRTSQPEKTEAGKLLSRDGKSRYVDSALYCDLGEEDMHEVSEDDEAGQSAPAGIGSPAEGFLSSALLSVSQNLVDYHPSHHDAMKLWAQHVQHAEPLIKVLHIPTTAKLIEMVSQQPTRASKAQECLLFSIYYFAVFTMTEEDCMRGFGQSRTTLMSKYQNAFRQALINASWLKTTEILVMQAFVLFLIAVRTQIDPQTFWIMTGVAVRIAQRIGLHRDGESLGLAPFDVEIRRRLFWQLLPLDGYAGQLSGTGISIAPNSWDTRQPLNINDDQIYPGMTQQPEEQEGATEMIYCLMRTELTKLCNRTGVKVKDIGATIQLRSGAELGQLIDEVESTIETKYLRYCDIVNPLHFLTCITARCAANSVRLHCRMPQMNQTISDQERRELCVIAQQILDTDSASNSNPHLKKFQWMIRAFYLWGALVFILTSLAKTDFFSRLELDGAWSKIADVFSNHPEVLDAKGALHVVAAKVTLKAWLSNPPTHSTPEPAFITAIRAQRATKSSKKTSDSATEPVTPLASTPGNDANTLFGSLDGMDLNLDCNFTIDTENWTFWDQLIHDYHAMPNQQQHTMFQ
jgi:Fungal specific transcription factor domain